MIHKNSLGEDEKKKYAIIFTVILIFALCGDWFALHFIKSSINPHDIEFQTGNTIDYNRYQLGFIDEVSIDEVFRKIDNNETFYLLLSREGCYTCSLYMPIIRDIIDELNIKNMYFLNRGKYNLDNDDFRIFNEKYANVKYTPYIMYFKDGRLVDDLIGKRDKKEVIDWIIKSKGE